MSGYKGDSNPSSLGGGVPGKFEAGFGNTMVGSDVAMNRKKLRKAFKTNKINDSGTIKKSSAGPFRTAFNLGDPLGRRNVRKTTSSVPLQSGNAKFVSDSSLYTEFKHLRSVNLNYNDKTGGGDESNASFSDLNRVRG